MPLRSLMYFFIFDTTMRTSRSTFDDSAGLACGAGAGGAGVITLRAVGAGAGSGSGAAACNGTASCDCLDDVACPDSAELGTCAETSPGFSVTCS